MTTTLDAPLLPRVPVTPRAPTPSAAPSVDAAPIPRLRRVRYEPEPDHDRPTPLPQATVLRPAAFAARAAARDVAPPDPAHPPHDPLRQTLVGVVRLALEVLDGRRPPSQLDAHFGAAALRYWRVATQQRRVRSPARVGRVVLCRPRPGAAELAAVCTIDGRVRALAARFEQADTAARWRCTALRLG